MYHKTFLAQQFFALITTIIENRFLLGESQEKYCDNPFGLKSGESAVDLISAVCPDKGEADLFLGMVLRPMTATRENRLFAEEAISSINSVQRFLQSGRA